jgi:alpha-galactosidase/6-phospho-beta-glucosidase family protein
MMSKSIDKTRKPEYEKVCGILTKQREEALAEARRRGEENSLLRRDYASLEDQLTKAEDNAKRLVNDLIETQNERDSLLETVFILAKRTKGVL